MIKFKSIITKVLKKERERKWARGNKERGKKNRESREEEGSERSVKNSFKKNAGQNKNYQRSNWRLFATLSRFSTSVGVVATSPSSTSGCCKQLGLKHQNATDFESLIQQTQTTGVRANRGFGFTCAHVHDSLLGHFADMRCYMR